MASFTTEELLAAALNLPPEERAELARDLLASLDEGDDLAPEEWEAAWSDEIEKRLREIRSGEAKLIDGDEALRQVRRQLQSRSQ
jgi:putative addiction module component (TIGR02574 family)